MKAKDVMTMPKVGTRLMRIMTGINFGDKFNTPEPCLVVYVSEPKHYYTVKFVNTGIKESYKVPYIDDQMMIKKFKEDYKRVFGKYPTGVYVYESGELYPTIAECARSIGVCPGTISKHLRGQTTNVKGYHIYRLDL